MPFLSLKIQKLNILQVLKTYCEQIDNSSARLGFFMSKDLHESVSEHCKAHGIILNEVVPSYLQGFSLTRNHFLFALLEETTLELTSTGIVQKMHADFFKKSQILVAKKEPKVLTVSSLAFCFEVWLVTCVFSIFAFFCEFLVFYVSKLIREGLGLMGLRVILNMRIYWCFSSLIQLLRMLISEISSTHQSIWHFF